MKQANRELLHARALRALGDLYHNATPTYPRELYGRSEDYAQAWLQDQAEFEIDYLRSGGAYGSNYRATLAAPCNAGRYKSERARAYYVAKGMREMRAERAKYAQWQRIGEFGKLYQYGRGGRTLAPDGLVKMRGGSSFSIREDAADCNAESLAELIQIVESFNRYVADWCASVPEQWREHCESEDAEVLAQKRADAARKAKETRERRYWEARGVVTE